MHMYQNIQKFTVFLQCKVVICCAHQHSHILTTTQDFTESSGAYPLIVAHVFEFIDTDITYMRRVVGMTEQAEKSQVDIVNAFTVVVPKFYYITVYIE